jgi:hypothetical protein
MSDEPGALSLRTSPPTEADYEKICNAVMETERGRWFLIEYARRNRNADTSIVLAAIDRIEATLRFQKAAALASPQPLSALQPELEDLKSIIVRTRENLAAIKPDATSAGKPADFSDIAQALERLSLQIRAAAERIQEAGWATQDGQPSDVRSGDVDAHASDIAAFCMSIEKVAAESHHVAMLLRTIEDRIDLFLSHANSAENADRDATARTAESAGASASSKPASGPGRDDALIEERSIEAGPEWAPPIIQTNGVAQSFVEPATSAAAPIKGPSGWLSKLAPVVSFTARFTDGADSAPDPREAVENARPATAPRPPNMPAVEREAARDKFANRTTSIVDTFFPASDTFKFDAKALPMDAPAEDPAAVHADEPADAAPAAAPGRQAPVLRADIVQADDTHIPESLPQDAPVAVSPKVTDLPSAEEAQTPPTASTAAEAEYTFSLMEALEREISTPWPDAPQSADRQNGQADELGQDEAAIPEDGFAPAMPMETAREDAALAALDHDDFGSNRSKIINAIDSNSLEHDVLRKPLRTFRHHALETDVAHAEDLPPPAKTPADKAVSMAALEAAIESFRTTALDELGPAKPVAETTEPAEKTAGFSDLDFPETKPQPSPEVPPAASLPEQPGAQPEPQSSVFRTAGGSPTRVARRVAAVDSMDGRIPPQTRPPARQTPLDFDLEAIPDRWLDDVLYEPRAKGAKPAASGLSSAVPEIAATSEAKDVSLWLDENPASPAAALSPETETLPRETSQTPAIRGLDAERDELKGTETAEEAERQSESALVEKVATIAGATAQGGSAAVVATSHAKVAMQATAAVHAVAGGAARQGGAAPQIRKPVPPPLSPVFGARGFRAERPNGNGRALGGRVADQANSGAQPAAQKPNDPLAPIMALSEEERIALFS